MASSSAAPEVNGDIDPLALERQVCFALAVTNRAVLAVYRPLLEPLGLTHPQYLVMLALWGEQPLSVTDLSRLLDVDAGTLSRLLKRLEAADLIVRRRDPADERSLAVTLTSKGTSLRQQALKVPIEVVQRLGMSLDDLHAMHAQLTGVIAAAKLAAS